jgi:hypothetical protein
VVKSGSGDASARHYLSILQTHPAGYPGRYFIEVEQDRHQVGVENTAYVVWSLRCAITADRADECIQLLLSDGSAENPDAETLRSGDSHIPYCKVKDRHLEARFSRAAYYMLAERVRHDPPGDAFFLSLNGWQYCLA